ncbi:hypothetical protein FHX82_005091 [Amycolatopsis bartoniae]|uniref:Uncharacterized protein n=1 Tax=Amycolatopsis bartoniae TaxID=941986 RepID=A0A8H9M9N4_9PSEU|nr:hypothetical protein [Amycolatopsis bartoniae]MBB2938015.1 hypothetical protein [Amycolatopsis bartoniae]TVT06130.1 hypothetical protein FNH07_21600 [Amycolatopsis bartoniae]GHF42346.1 hypothetical protein GCM10017566_14920 [Amycolatopsis bartoniae]
MKRLAVVTAVAVAFCCAGGGLASAATSSDDSGKPTPSFETAYPDFKEGGAALGYGVASLFASGTTAIVIAPAVLKQSLRHVRG